MLLGWEQASSVIWKILAHAEFGFTLSQSGLPLEIDPTILIALSRVLPMRGNSFSGGIRCTTLTLESASSFDISR